MKAPQSPRGGFSFIELAMAVGIMLTLLALLFPAFRSVKRVNASARCAANLRQFALAVQARAADTGDILPYKEWVPDPNPEIPAKGGAIWRTQLLPYLPLQNDLETCPAESLPFKGYTQYCHYGWSISTSGSNRPFRKVLEIKHPSRMMIMGDSFALHWYLVFYGSNNGPITEGSTGGISFRHGKRANFVFLDGHIEALRIEEVPTITARYTPPFEAFWGGR